MKGIDTTNLERSEQVIAAVLAKLAEAGMQSINLGFNDLDLPNELNGYFDMSAMWLMSEGIISASNFSRLLGGPGTLIEPMLTSKGLGMLGRRVVFRDQEADTTEAVAAIAKGDRSFWQVGDLIGSILGGFTKSIGG